MGGLRVGGEAAGDSGERVRVVDRGAFALIFFLVFEKWVLVIYLSTPMYLLLESRLLGKMGRDLALVES